MPGIPLVTRETTVARSADQMCRDSRVHLSAEEQAAAEESLSLYCKPVELYNILQRRAATNPSFLQRCLNYKIQANHKRRIQISIALSSTVNDELRVQSFFPLCIFLAKQVPSVGVAKDSAVYRVSRICTLTSSTGVEGTSQAQAKFILPEISKLSEEVKSGSFAVLFISCAELTKDQIDVKLFPSNVTGPCLLGKIPMEFLRTSLEKTPNLSLGERNEMLFMVEMQPQYMKSTCLVGDTSITFQIPHTSGDLATSEQLQVIITAEEVGAKERSPYNLYSYHDVPTPSSSDIIRLRNGNAVFNYKYYNNRLHRTEVTENFSCPFCLVMCASFKGLRCHLTATHDLFNFEFWVTEEYQAVNVSVKVDTCRSEIVADVVDPKKQIFFFCSKPLRRRELKSSHQTAIHVQPLVLDLPVSLHELQDNIEVGTTECVELHSLDPNMVGVSSAMPQPHADPDCGQSLPGINLTPPAMLQFAKTRKLSMERSDPRSRALLQKRQFFHSHRAQPMALEQLLSDQDSEDEVDDDVADLEDRRMLDDFVDVTKDEKKMMHLWNSFVRKQRVLADGHIPWACEAFTKMHGQDFVLAPSLLWCWRLFMIKLSNHGLLDARTMNNCNIILEEYQGQNQNQNQNQNADPMQS